MRSTLGSRIALPCLSFLLGIGCDSSSLSPPIDSSPDGNAPTDAPAPSPEAGKDSWPVAGADAPYADTTPPEPDAQGTARLDDADATVGIDVTGGIDGPASKGHGRVLLVDKARDLFAAYDASGQAVHDYHALLDFGSGYDAPWISLDGNMARWSTATDLITGIWWVRPAQGRSDPVVASTLVIVAPRTGGGSNRIKLASMAGDVLSTVDLPGDFDGYALSPQGRNLVATKYGNTAIVVRLADKKELWRGASGTGAAAFSPDDKHMIAAWTPEVPFELVDLENARIIKPATSSLPFPYTTDRNHVEVKAALNAGAVISADYGYGETLTEHLWWVDWDGKLSPLDPSLPQYASEDFVRWDAAGTKALWNRTTSLTAPGFAIGKFSFDVVSKQLQAWKDVGQAQRVDSSDCFDGRFATFYGVLDGALSACDCASGDCHKIADLPAMTAEWDPEVLVSPDRGVVAVHYNWMLSSRTPTSGGETQFFRSAGVLMTTVPYGWLKYGPDSSLVLLNNIISANTGVLNLANGTVTWLGAAKFAAAAYE